MGCGFGVDPGGVADVYITTKLIWGLDEFFEWLFYICPRIMYLLCVSLYTSLAGTHSHSSAETRLEHPPKTSVHYRHGQQQAPSQRYHGTYLARHQH